MTKFFNLYDKILQIISCDVCANVKGYYNYRYFDILLMNCIYYRNNFNIIFVIIIEFTIEPNFFHLKRMT